MDTFQLIFYFSFLSMLIGLAISAFLLRGFFFPYLVVKASRGKYILIKIKSPLRHIYKVGKFKDSMLSFKLYKEKHSIAITDETAIYRLLGVNSIDYDEETSAIKRADYQGVSSYDPVKFENLHTRALMRPTITNMQEKIIIILLIINCLLAAGSIYMGYISYRDSQTILTQSLPAIKSMIANTTAIIKV